MVKFQGFERAIRHFVTSIKPRLLTLFNHCRSTYYIPKLRRSNISTNVFTSSNPNTNKCITFLRRLVSTKPNQFHKYKLTKKKHFWWETIILLPLLISEHYYVILELKKVRIEKDILLQESVLVPSVLNIYNNDQPSRPLVYFTPKICTTGVLATHINKLKRVY